MVNKKIRFDVDEDWPNRITKKNMHKVLSRYYKLLRKAYPHIPSKVVFLRVNDKKLDAIATVKWNTKVTTMAFNSTHIRLFKLMIREFLHEMVHVIWQWGNSKHGPVFESRILRLRRQLFSNKMSIY